MTRKLSLTALFLLTAVFALFLIACNTGDPNTIITPDSAISPKTDETPSSAINPGTNLPTANPTTPGVTLDITPQTTTAPDTSSDMTPAPTTPTPSVLPTTVPPVVVTPTPPITPKPTKDPGPVFQYFQFKPTEKLVAVTFDDGPSNNTITILNKIEGTDAKVTFFVVGNRLKPATWAAATKKAISLGCEIGFHSWSHDESTYYTKLSDKALAEEIANTNELIRSLGGSDVTLLRPTGGFYTKSKDYGYPLILWSGDTEDWRVYGKYAKKNISYDEAVKQVTNAIVRDATANGGGNIVLLHDLYSTSADAFCRAYDILTEKGYKFVTVSELLNIQNKNASGYVFNSTYTAYYLGTRCQNA